MTLEWPGPSYTANFISGDNMQEDEFEEDKLNSKIVDDIRLHYYQKVSVRPQPVSESLRLYTPNPEEKDSAPLDPNDGVTE